MTTLDVSDERSRQLASARDGVGTEGAWSVLSDRETIVVDRVARGILGIDAEELSLEDGLRSQEPLRRRWSELLAELLAGGAPTDVRARTLQDDSHELVEVRYAGATDGAALHGVLRVLREQEPSARQLRQIGRQMEELARPCAAAGWELSEHADRLVWRGSPETIFHGDIPTSPEELIARVVEEDREVVAALLAHREDHEEERRGAFRIEFPGGARPRIEATSWIDFGRLHGTLRMPRAADHIDDVDAVTRSIIRCLPFPALVALAAPGRSEEMGEARVSAASHGFLWTFDVSLAEIEGQRLADLPIWEPDAMEEIPFRRAMGRDGVETYFCTPQPIASTSDDTRLLLFHEQSNDVVRSLDMSRFVDQALHRALSVLPVVVFGVNSEGTFFFSKGSGLEMAGLSDDEIIGTSAWSLYGNLRMELPDGTISDGERVLRMVLNGEQVRYRASVGAAEFDNWLFPFPDDDGGTYCVGVAIDVSELAEHARLSGFFESRYRALLDSNLVAVAEVVGDGTIVDANRHFLELLGISWQTIAEERPKIWSFLSSASVPRLPEYIKQLGAVGEIGPITATVASRSGRERHTLAAASQLRGHSGEGGERFGVYLVDVTEALEAVRALRDPARNPSYFLESLSRPALALDEDDRVVAWNGAMERLLRVPATQAVGAPLPEELAELRYQGSAIGEVVVRRSDGSRARFGVSGASLSAGRTRVFVFHALDGTELQDRRRATRPAAVDAGQLAAGVAFELNDVLSVVMGYTALAADAVGSDSPVHEELEEVGRAAEAAARLSRRLLALGGMQVRHPRNIDVRDVVQDIVERLDGICGTSIDCRFDYADEECPVYADPAQIQQIVTALVSRSVQLVGDAGWVSVSVDVEEEPGEADARRKVRIRVTDSTSPGSSPQAPRIERGPLIDGRWHELERLELAVARGVVHQCEGTLSAAQGEGAAGIVVRLPYGYVDRPQRVTPRVDSAPESAAGGTESTPRHVLVVEDDDAIRDVARRGLVAAGFDVHVASNGVEAIAVADELDSLDLLVTDLVMPGIGGVSLTRMLRAKMGTLPVVFLAGRADESLEDPDIVSESVILDKPFSIKTLVEIVGWAIGQWLYDSERDKLGDHDGTD